MLSADLRNAVSAAELAHVISALGSLSRELHRSQRLAISQADSVIRRLAFQIDVLELALRDTRGTPADRIDFLCNATGDRLPGVNDVGFYSLTKEMSMKFQIYTDIAGEYRWRLKSPNGKTVAVSGEGYVNETNCREGIRLTTLVTDQTSIQVLQADPTFSLRRWKLLRTSRSRRIRKSSGKVLSS